MDGLRMAALKLHGAAAADRNWILSQFDRSTRRRLNGLLRDLRRSGIDPGTIGQIDSAPPRKEPQPRPVVPDSVVRLEQADAGAIERVLADEPAWVIAAVVNARSWAWRDAVLKRLKRRRKVLRRGLPSASPRPAVVSAFLDSLARRLDQGPSKFEELVGGPFARSGWLRSRLKAWTS
jgi:hypothetical protein